MQPLTVKLDSRALAIMRGVLDRMAGHVPEKIRLEALAAGLGLASVLDLRRAIWTRPTLSVDGAAFANAMADHEWIIGRAPIVIAAAHARRGGRGVERLDEPSATPPSGRCCPCAGWDRMISRKDKGEDNT